jgi:sensor histidine kinase regulating citrate/malate metabolism
LTRSLKKGGEIILDWIYDEEQKKLLLQVQDNGPGANKEVLNVLNSGEATSSIKEKGSGIGVFTVHSMLRKIGGSIVCESKESEGIIWTIEIPSYEINVSQFSEPLDDNKKQISFTI